MNAPEFNDNDLALIEGLARMEISFLGHVENRGFQADSTHVAKLGILSAKARTILNARADQRKAEEVAAKAAKAAEKEKSP